MSDSKEITEYDPPKRLPLQTVRGLTFPKLVFFQPHCLEQTMSLKPRDTDIFVVTYPKCGTTWTQYIVWEVLHKGAPPPSPNQMMFRHFPFLEATGTDTLEDLPPPRVMKTHLPFGLNPYNPKAKYVYVVRNPWDCSVSYYNHIVNFGLADMKFHEFLECFLQGQVGWGDFFDHALSWYEHKDDPNVLFLTYEDMKVDRRKTILNVAKFLGEEYYQSVLNEEVMENCLKHSDFRFMKGLGFFSSTKPHSPPEDAKPEDLIKMLGEVDRQTADTAKLEEVPFFRKGVVGDWKNHFSQKQLEKFHAHMSRKLKNTEMENFWKPVVQETSL